jgi:Zn-finger domain-containing protein
MSAEDLKKMDKAGDVVMKQIHQEDKRERLQKN